MAVPVVVEAWSRGVKVPFDGVVDCPVDPQMLLRALENGMPASSLQCDGITDEHLKHCPGLVSLKASRRVTDGGIAFCPLLKVLNAADCDLITKCPPTVEELDASGGCGIGDAGLVGATSLRKLIASNNWKITVCPPNLVYLDASGSCGIVSLEGFDTIETLDVSYHIVPLLSVYPLKTFVKRVPGSVKVLRVKGRCSEELANQIPELSLVELDISFNEVVEALPPTLEVLIAPCWHGSKNRINDQVLERCTRLRHLDISHTKTVTKCPESVRTLIADYVSRDKLQLPAGLVELEIKISNDANDITDANIAHCTSLKRLRVKKSRITQGLPDSLEELYMGEVALECELPQGLRILHFDDCEDFSKQLPSGLERLRIRSTRVLSSLAVCENLRVLDVAGVRWIRYCPSTVEELDARGNCGISDKCVRNVKVLLAAGNPRITARPAACFNCYGTDIEKQFVGLSPLEPRPAFPQQGLPVKTLGERMREEKLANAVSLIDNSEPDLVSRLLSGVLFSNETLLDVLKNAIDREMVTIIIKEGFIEPDRRDGWTCSDETETLKNLETTGATEEQRRLILDAATEDTIRSFKEYADATTANGICHIENAELRKMIRRALKQYAARLLIETTDRAIFEYIDALWREYCSDLVYEVNSPPPSFLTDRDWMACRKSTAVALEGLLARTTDEKLRDFFEAR